jgi:two-component system CheB/CheR fusion protein
MVRIARRCPGRTPDARIAPTAPPYFPIIGIGASAGGLEALEVFLRRIPRRSGAGYVVVQHLDPSHKGMLVELLQRATPMPVVEASDGVEVDRDHVYVIPPNKDMSLLHGTLHLLPLPTHRGRVLPIDFFFRSLAEDQQERSIGVILSGMGTDGTLGLRAIKEKAGAAFVQAPASARFDGMPRSAIDAGLADVVAPVEELPGRIDAYRAHATFIAQPGTRIDEAALEKIAVLLRSKTGNDFSLYKWSTLVRRIERRMGLHQLDSLDQYVRLLRDNPIEIDLLFKELLIGVTRFFRDPAEWEKLRHEVLPALVAARSTAGVLRAWVPGCSTGEEAYSLAILFREALEPFKSLHDISLQIFATDLDRDAIDTARHGVYPDNITADLSPERLRRYFVRDGHGYRVSTEIREIVVFAPQNLLMDPPFTKVDVLVCRNSRSRCRSSCGSGPSAVPRVRATTASSSKRRRGGRRRTSRRSSIGCWCSGSRRSACCATTAATSSTSAGGRASTSSPRSARPTSTCSRWRARSCATSCRARSTRRCAAGAWSTCAASRSGPTAAPRPSISWSRSCPSPGSSAAR